MVPLRVIAIVSNLAFISYAAMEGLVPVLVLHTLLLPVNLSRLYEIKKLIDFTRNAPENSAPIDAIIPFMNQKSIARGEHLFRKGDYSKNMYYVVDGTLRLVEIGKIIDEGAIIGEIGLFSPSRERTATAIAETDCQLLSIDDASLYQAYYQNPKIGFYLLQLIARRFSETQTDDQQRVSADAARSLPFV